MDQENKVSAAAQAAVNWKKQKDLEKSFTHWAKSSRLFRAAPDNIKKLVYTMFKSVAATGKDPKKYSPKQYLACAYGGSYKSLPVDKLNPAIVEDKLSTALVNFNKSVISQISGIQDELSPEQLAALKQQASAVATALADARRYFKNGIAIPNGLYDNLNDFVRLKTVRDWLNIKYKDQIERNLMGWYNSLNNYSVAVPPEMKKEAAPTDVTSKQLAELASDAWAKAGLGDDLFVVLDDADAEALPAADPLTESVRTKLRSVLYEHQQMDELFGMEWFNKNSSEVKKKLTNPGVTLPADRAAKPSIFSGNETDDDIEDEAGTIEVTKGNTKVSPIDKFNQKVKDNAPVNVTIQGANDQVVKYKMTKTNGIPVQENTK